jgi:hypothetical protein
MGTCPVGPVGKQTLTDRAGEASLAQGWCESSSASPAERPESCAPGRTGGKRGAPVERFILVLCAADLPEGMTGDWWSNGEGKSLTSAGADHTIAYQTNCG